MGKTKHRAGGLGVWACLLLAALLLCPVTAWGDMGPKPQLTVHVRSGPEEPYYLDLLVQEPTRGKPWREDGETDPEMLALLYSLQDEGWMPALADGTAAPMYGSFTGTEEEGGRLHAFSYVGVPQTCRIIVVTKSGAVTVSQPFTRAAMQASVTYDYAANRVRQSPVWLAYLLQFISTYVPTVLAEGLLLLAFGFTLRENWKALLLVNLATQVGLTASIGRAMILSGPILAYIIQAPAELAILALETLAYCKLLKGKGVGRRVGYSVTANLVSWLGGFLLLWAQYLLVFFFLTHF